MRITCPQCGFSRDIHDEKVPETSELATCPKCSHRFRFRTLTGVETPPAAPAAPAASPKDSKDREEDFWAGIERMEPPPDRHFSRREDTAESASARHDEPEIDVPFERLNKYGFFPGIRMTIQRALFSPRLFFRVMPLRGLGLPLAFHLLLFEFSLVIGLLWSKTGLPPLSDIHPLLGFFDAAEGGPMGPLHLFLLYPAMSAVMAFVSSGLVHFVLKLVRSGERGFEATFRAQAYSNAAFILAVLPYGQVVGHVWGLVIFVIGLKNAHRTSGIKVALAFGVILALQALLIWWAMQAGLRALPPEAVAGPS